MSRSRDQLTITFLQGIEKTEKEISVHRHATERIKAEAHRLLFQLSQELIQSYYKRQFISLDILFPYFSPKSTQKTTQLHQKVIAENKPLMLVTTHFNPTETHQAIVASQVKTASISEPESEKVFADIDRRFSHLAEAYKVTGEVLEELSEVEEKLPPEVQKEAVALYEQAKQVTHDYQDIALAALMIVVGTVLIGITHGIGAAAGAGFIMEGVDKIHHVMAHHVTKPQNLVVTFDRNAAEFLNQLTEAEKNNHATLNDVWITCIQTHCRSQQKSLEEMKSALQTNDLEHRVLITHIDGLLAEYQHQEAAIEVIKKMDDAGKKTEALRNIATTIEQKEADHVTQQLMQDVKAKLPEQLKSEPSHFLHRAKNFCHNNKSIIQLAAIMALTITGVALTVATGGVAGVLGAAILGAVAFNSGRSVVQHVKQVVLKHPGPPAETKGVNALLNDWIDVNETHCERQAASTRIISASLEGGEFPHVKAELEHATEEFKESAAALNALGHDAGMSPHTKTQEITAITKTIHQTNEATINAIHAVGDNLSSSAKTESQKIFNRAQHFYHDNKSIIQSVGKVMLAVSALAVMGVATGGVGVAVALGFAAVSWVVKKAGEKITAIKQKNEAHEDEHEGEGEKKAVKEDAIKTEGLTGHH
ncbi:MAG: hypothetical protein A3F13_06080 [Gammaproteobacteria bacterium RIFCSPHIGHO2_12_FULL_40_19]|nr:MAG: hypothetical protein A3F13_06080 [Gammaproteobacteria bacterium RIFCSPHIGHO2_12_FULL_40_19]